jgi:ABC-2 type transport system permease protein
MIARLIALVAKEFLALLKDPKSRFVIIGPPVVQLLVFGYAATFDLTHVPFAIYNESPSAEARDLVARFRGSDNFAAAAVVTRDEQIAPLIDSKLVLLVVHIGPRFSRNLMSLTLADWFVIQVKVLSFFMITWVTASRPDRFDGHG